MQHVLLKFYDNEEKVYAIRTSKILWQRQNHVDIKMIKLQLEKREEENCFRNLRVFKIRERHNRNTQTK